MRLKNMKKGRVIYLNGTTSSGKTTVAKNFELLEKEPYLYLGLDTFIGMLPLGYFGKVPPADQCMLITPFIDEEGHNQVKLEYGPMAMKLIKVMYETVRLLAEEGLNVIFDDVYWDLLFPAKILKGIDVILVSIYAPLDVLETREVMRSNRTPGMARWQFSRIYPEDRVYDLEIDTSKISPEEAVKQIQDFLKNGTSTAFDKIRKN